MDEYRLARTFHRDRASLYRLISGIEKYPDFVPGYQAVQVHKRTANTIRVTQTVRILGLEMSFDSVATLDAPRLLTIDAFPPGYKSMHIEWRFDSLGDENTRISVTVRYEGTGFLAGRLSRPWIGAFVKTQLRAFTERANRLGKGEHRP